MPELIFEPNTYNLSGWQNQAAQAAINAAPTGAPVSAVTDLTIRKDGDRVIVEIDRLSTGLETAIINAFEARLEDLEHVATR